MFFDEKYNELLYSYQSVKYVVKNSDCLLVIGTALETGFALDIVNDFV